MTDPLTPDTTPEPAATPAPAVAAEAPAEPQTPVVEAVQESEPVQDAEPAPVLEVPVAEPAPLAAPAPAAAAPAQSEVFGLPLKLLNELLAKIGATPLQSLADLVPALRILALAVVAAIALKLTSATIGAIDDLPLVGGLLELVGLVSLLNFLARNAFKQQKRAELLARIQKLKTDLLG